MLNHMKTKFFILSLLLATITVFSYCQTPAIDTTTVEYRMISAVKTGDSVVFAELLKSNPSLISIKDPVMEEPLLHVAARYNQYGMVRKLLDMGLDVNAKNRLGSIPLHLACITGSYAMVKDLLAKGSDYSLVNMRGKAPISYISYGKNPDLFKLFLEKDKTILKTVSQDGADLLFSSVIVSDTAGISYLLTKGFDINSKDLHHFTPLNWAVRNQDTSLMKWLIKKGANPNSTIIEGKTPLLFAIEMENLELVRILADAGAKVNVADSVGLTGLHKCAVFGNRQIAAYLMKKGVSIDAKDENGRTPLHYAAIYGHSDIGKDLIMKGANPGLMDKQQHSPVYYSKYYGNKSMTQVLVKPGAKEPDLKVSIYQENLKPGEAVVHYLNHSGYAIETSKYLLVFDYFHYLTPPDDLTLLNGRINPEELQGKKIIVFSSHQHPDHYDTTIWKLSGMKNIHYVMGFKPEVKYPYDFIEPRQEKSIDGVRIHAIRSTDSGEGFLVEADGIVVYHPGDHTNKDKGLGQDFKSEIDYLASLNKKVDIAFYPVAGCGFPDPDVVRDGNLYVMKTLKPEINLMIHGQMTQCARFSKEVCRVYPEVHVEYGQFPGDRFNYSLKSAAHSLQPR